MPDLLEKDTPSLLDLQNIALMTYSRRTILGNQEAQEDGTSVRLSDVLMSGGVIGAGGDMIYLLEREGEPYWFSLQKKTVALRQQHADLFYFQNLSPVISASRA